MKSKNMIALLLAGSMSLSLCACTSSDNPSSSTAAQAKPETTVAAGQTTEAVQTTEAASNGAAETKTWGDWTVEVPAEFELVGKGFSDENDPRYFAVQKSIFKFFEFSADGEENIMNHYNYNKNTYTNEQKDVSGTFGGNEWTGFQYSDGYGGYGFEAYTTVDGEIIRVSSCGFQFDDEMTKTVLGSLKYTPTEKPAEPETEAPETAAPETEAPETEATSEQTGTTDYEPTEGAPVYAKTVALKDVTLGIKEGYTEMKDGSPYQYVMTNDTTGGNVFIQNMAGKAEETVTGIMNGLDYELSEMDLNGMHWVVAKANPEWCFSTTIGEDSLTFTIAYGATEEEMEDLIFGVMLNSEE